MRRLSLFVYSMIFAAGMAVSLFSAASLANTNLQLKAFNPSLYELAYKTFLQNNNIHDAFLVAEAANQQLPNDKAWQRRLAEVAVLTNKPGLALQLWVDLIRADPNKTNVDAALRLSKIMHDHESTQWILKEKIKLGDKQESTVKDLAYVSAELGAPEYAVSILAKQYKKTKSQELLRSIHLLHQQLGIPEQTEKLIIAEDRDTTGHDWLLLERAKQAYEQGNIEQSITILRNNPQLYRVNKQHSRWLAELSWEASDEPTALRAYQKLYRQGKAKLTDLERLLILLQRSNQKQQAYRVAKQAWQQTHDIKFVPILLVLGIENKDWHYLDHLLRSLTHQQKQQLLRETYYYSHAAAVYMHFGDDYRAMELYQQGMARFPSDTQMRQDYLWMLVNNREADELEHTLYDWRHWLAAHPELTPLVMQMNEFLLYHMLEHDNFANVNISWQQIGGLRGPRYDFHGRYFITPHFAVLPLFEGWYLHRNQIPGLFNLPNRDVRGGLGAVYKFENGDLYAWVVHRNSAENFWEFAAARDFDLTPQLYTRIFAGVNQISFDTEALRVLGVKDLIRNDWRYVFNPYYEIYAEVSGGYLRDQERDKLANTFHGYVELDRNLVLTPPFISVGIFASTYSYHSTGLTPFILQHVQPGIVPGRDFVIPVSSNQYGARFMLGLRHLNDYAPHLLPFIDASVFHNTRFGVGYTAALGLATELFGHDHLAFMWRYAKNLQDDNRRDMQWWLSYRWYFG